MNQALLRIAGLSTTERKLFKAGRAIAVLCAAVLWLACALDAGVTRAAAAGPTATVSGTLVAGGVLTGAAAVSLTASGAGGGVRSAAITVDGVQLASADGSAVWLDTGMVHDGNHVVTVTMTDIAGDSGPVWTGLVQTQNAPQGGAAAVLGQAQEGQTLVADTAGWSPQPIALAYQWQRCDAAGGACSPIPGANAATYTPTAAEDYGQLDVIVTASDTGGATSATSAGSGVVLDAQGGASPPPLDAPLGAALAPGARAPAGGSIGTAAPPSATGAGDGGSGAGACSDARLRAPFAGAARVSIAFGRSVTLRGSLRCGALPLKRALLRVVVTPAMGGAPTRRAQIRTRADGSFAYAVAPGPSRRIHVSYSGSGSRHVAAASASASVVVTPEISLAITPTHTTNGHTITFSGQVSGGDEPRGGLPLQLEYREGSRWMVYQVVRADPRDGRFRYRYTFERTTQSITYTFRFAIPPSGVAGYPYAPAVSPQRSVHVDP